MAEIGQLSYSIILDDKKFAKQAQGIVKKLKDVDTQINELMSSDSTRLSKPFDLAGMSIEKMVTQAKVLEVAFKGLSQSGTGVLSQDAINLKLRWQEIQAEVSKYGLNLKSSLMEQQKIVEPLKNLQQVLAMPTNSLDEVAAKLSEVKRIRAEQIQTDASYISNMSVLNKVEGELIAQQKSAIFIGKEALTIEQQLTSELQKRPISINGIIASAKNLEVLYKSLDDKESALGVEAQQRWLGMRDQLQSYGYTIKSSVMEQQTLNGALAMQENTVGQIELKMRALASVRKGINITEKESIETLKRVNDEYMRLGDQLKKVGARQYNLADMARNTNGAFSPLGFSIQQVARELPSLTMGAQMFFLAISNNLPILSDELRKAKASYAALIAENKQATPVWKQVLSSIFSWQTAMVVGITLLTMYGREIGNWVKGLFGASKANEELAKSLDEINKSYSAAILEGSKNAKKELTNLNLLYKASQNDRISKEERKKAVDELQKQYPSYFKNLTDEQILAGKASAAYLSLSESIIKSARARAAADKITENQSKILDLEAKNTEALLKRDELALKKKKAEADLAKKDPNLVNYNDVNAVKIQNDAIKDQNQIISDNVDQINALNKANEKLSKNINITDLTFEIDKSKKPQQKTPKDTTAQQDKFAQEQIRAAEDLQTKIRQAEIDAMNDGFEKRITQMKLNHQTEIREIDRQREDLLRKIVDNERKLFEANPANKGKKFEGFIMPDIANEMKSFNGNVDLLSRKMIDASELVKKGWEDAGEGIATVFSSQFGISGSSGKEHEILVTPILPDGSVLSPSELGDYIDNVLNDSEDILKSDNKGIVIAIDVDKNGKAGEKLHQLQELYYGLSKSKKEYRLSDIQESEFTKFRLNTEKKQNKELSDEYSKALEKYRTYAEARIDVIKKFESERKTVVAAGGSDENLSELNRQQKVALSELDKQYAMKEESFQKWLDGVANLSLDKLITSLREAELALSLSQISLKGENDPSRNTQQVAVLRQQIEALKKQIETEKNKKTGKKNSDDPSRTIKDWKRLESVLDRVAKSFDEIGEQVGGTVGDIISAAGSITTSTLSMINGITQLANWSATSVELTAKSASEAIKTVERASVILAIIGAALQIATKIASLFGADYSEYNKARKAYESYVAVLDKVIEKQKELVDTMTGENAQNSYEYALQLINEQVLAARELGKLRLNSGASVGSHSIGVRIQKNMSKEGKDQARAVLGENFDKVFSGRLNGLFDLSVEQLKELQEKAPLFWAQLDEETREHLEDIIASEQAMQDLIESYQKSLTGLSFDDARDSLKDFLLDTDTTMQDIADNFEDYMKNAIVNSLIKGELNDKLKKWYENFAGYMQDGVLSDKELAKSREEYNKIIEDAINKRDAAYNAAGIVSGTNIERTGVSGSFARASQDSIDEMTGVMYAGLEKLSLTSNGINAINITTTAMSAELKAQTALLRSIDNYSSNLPDINNNSKYIRTSIDTMVNQGVRIKP